MAEDPSPAKQEEKESPMDRVWAGLTAVGIIALGAAMIIWPDAISDDGIGGRKFLARVIEWVWGRPGGVVILIGGILVLIMVLVLKPVASTEAAPADKK